MSDFAERDFQDKSCMQQAITLAAEAAGMSWPAPLEACLLIGPSGTVAHAAANRGQNPCLAALQQAGSAARGATAYILQESALFPAPQGADPTAVVRALAEAGVRRVIAGAEHADPTLAGKGLAALRSAGVEVATNVLGPSIRNVTRAYRKWCRSGQPYITLLATTEAAVKDIRETREESFSAAEYRAVARHGHDALLVDLADVEANPTELFQDGSGLPRSRKLLRIVNDPKLEIDPSSALVASWDDDLLLLAAEADLDRVDAIRGVGIGVELLDGASPWRSLLFTVAHLPLYSILVEARGATAAALLAEQLVDEVTVFTDAAAPLPPVWLPVQPAQTVLLPLSSGLVAASFLLNAAA